MRTKFKIAVLLVLVIWFGFPRLSSAQESTGVVKETVDTRIVDPPRDFIQDKNAQVQSLQDVVKSTARTATPQVPDSLPGISTIRERTVKDRTRTVELLLRERVNHVNPTQRKQSVENSRYKPIDFHADQNGNNLDQLLKQGSDAVKELDTQERIDPAFIKEEIIRVDPAKELEELNMPSFEELKSAASMDNGASDITDAAKKILSLDGINMFGLSEPPNLANATKGYSEKLIQRIKDSLGVDEAKKILGSVSALTRKQVSQDKYIKALSQVAPERSLLNNVNIEEGVIENSDQEKINGLYGQVQAADLSSIRLPDSILSELEPLRNYKVPEKYAKLVDSLRHINFSKADMELEERKITEETKAAIAKRKPTFFNKMFAEMVIGYLRDGNVNLYQASPTLSYYLTQQLSLGAGPSLRLRTEDKDLNLTLGFRGLVKMELMKQRAYLQFEDNVEPSQVDVERITALPHTFLGGAGVLLPISNRIAINACLLHRLNTARDNASSPWVFRLGISSLKIK